MRPSPRQPKFLHGMNTPRRRELAFETLEERRVFTASPELVADIFPGAGEWRIQEFTNVNGTLFFTASDGVHGEELWKSDGTRAGTVMVKDIVVGNLHSTPKYLTNFNGQLFFTTNDYQIWKSDGTASGTVHVNDVSRLRFSKQMTGGFEVSNGNLFFAATTGLSADRTLWKSDGTDAGTLPVLDYRFYPDALFNMGNTLFIVVEDSLWKSDGTKEGTIVLNDNLVSFPGDYPFVRNLTNVGGKLYFSVHGSSLSGLWTSDGTVAGTHAIGSDVSPKYITNVNGTIFFSSGDAEHGVELWKSNGTDAGTMLVKDLNTLPVPRFPQETKSSYPHSLVNLNGTLFFGAFDNTASRLWKSDGTSEGTIIVENELPAFGGKPRPVNVNGTLLFSADQTTNTNGSAHSEYGLELWKSDGSATGTQLISDIRSGSASSNPLNFIDINGTLFFTANDGVHGRELWKVTLPTLNATLTNGTLTVTDTAGKNNRITYSRSSKDLIVYDAAEQFASAPAGGKLSNNNHTLTLPLSAITGTVIMNTGAGNDVVNIDGGRGALPQLKLDLGSDVDTLGIARDMSYNIWNLTGTQSGTLNVYPPANVAFSGLEIARGGAKQDVFKLLNPGINGIQTFNGGGSNMDKIEFQRNANVTLTSSKFIVGGLATAQTFSFASIESAKLTGGAGNNIFDASGFNGPTYMRGGSGNDILIGSNFSDVIHGDGGDDWLSGNGGDDTLLGWNGRDILVGGLGADKLNGGGNAGPDTGDDLLIGGTTLYDTNKASIDFLLSSWANPFIYTGHIAKLTSGVGPKDKYKLTALTVLDDNASDILIGGTGNDWFFAGTSGTNKDTHDKSGIEQVMEV